MSTRHLATRLVIIAGLSLSALPAAAQKAYASADEAARALVDALATSDPQALNVALGQNWKRFIPTEGIDSEEVQTFLAAWAKNQRVVTQGDIAHLQVGEGNWELPIPIVRQGNAWRFDPRAAADEIRTRRIGRNEIDVANALLAVYDAQKEYALQDRNGDGVLEYAQKFISTQGKQDGLYWATLPSEPDSPLGPLYSSDLPGDGYLGYRYKLLTSQGPNAPGGAFDYRIKGRLVGGFGVLAWPARYGDTGVTSFIVSHNGVVYQKDLGPNSAALAKSITRFDPDSTWTKAAP